MANPRKFSEKIALQKQKQAEETAEFEKIMKEVSDAAGKQDDFHCNQRTLENDNKYSSSSNITAQKESRGRSAGVGPIRRLSDRKYERSPYSSGNVTYLSPPSESYWRRASSDSAINQSLIQSQNVDMTKVQHYHFIPGSTSQRPPPNSTNAEMETNHEMRNCSSATNIRHPSPECTLRLPSMNAFPAHHAGLLSSPLHKNSGSLPDLTSVHFQSQVNNNNSHFNREIRLESGPYIKSQAEPYTVMLQLDPQQNKFQQSPTTTPPSHIEPQILTNSCQEINQQNFTMPEPKKTAHLSFTNLPSLVNHKVENSEPINIPAVSNHGSHGHLSSIGIAASNLTEYRVNRPSPGSTPGIMNITGDSHMSAPCSPIPQNPEDPYSNNTAAECSLSKSVQDHFKQFSLLDSCGDGSIKLDSRTQNPVMFEFDDSIGGHPSPASESNERPFDSDENEGSSSKKIGHVNDVKLYVNLDHSLGYPQEALKAASYQNPATPTSIPEIVFSDFSSINCDLSKELFGSLDLELGPVDSAGLQMLSDPDSTLIEDPTIEDSFRRDIS